MATPLPTIGGALGLDPMTRRRIGNLLTDYGGGLLQGKNFQQGLGLGAQQSAQMQPYRDQQAQLESQVEKEATQSNATIEWLKSKGYTDLVAAVGGGLPIAQAWQEGLARANPASAGPVKGEEIAGRLVNPFTGEVMADFSSTEQPKPTSGIQEYEYARSQGYQGSFADFETEMKRAGATSIDFNQNQGTAAAYADRMVAADQILNDPALLGPMTDLSKQQMGNIPVAGNFLVGPEYQMAEQAQRDFVNAILRRESGAVISPSEFENAKKQYFPQPGDSQQVIEQKARNRQTAIQGVVRASGPNYQSPQVMGPEGVVDYTTYFGGQ